MAKVRFKTGTQEEYDALVANGATSNAALYYITDTQRLYKGTQLFSVGLEAVANSTAGLLSAEDKAKLDLLVVGYSIEQTDALLALKQDVLVSGNNIKTINSESILGNGDLEVTANAEAMSEEEIEEICQ